VAEVALLSGRLHAALPEAEIQMLARMRYRGQGAALEVSVDGDLASAFAALHQRRYGYVLADRPIELVALRGRAEVAAPELPSLTVSFAPAPHEQRPVWFDDLEVDTLIVRRGSLTPGERIHGPAIVTDYSATIVLPAGAEGVVLSDGSLDIMP
jgi:N-methylhydantoinase A/oxoprolinase/acetone carboxylase beta subunit